MTVKDDKKVDGVAEEEVTKKTKVVDKVVSTKRQELKQETEELLEIAKGKQKQRLDELKKSPAEAQMFMEKDERDELARHYVPEAFIHEKKENWRARGTKGEYKKGSTKTTSWTDSTKEWKRKMSNLGYLPVLDDGIQVSDGGGDILWEAPIEFEKNKIDKAARIHEDRIRAESSKFKAETSGVGISTEDSLTFTQ